MSKWQSNRFTRRRICCATYSPAKITLEKYRRATHKTHHRYSQDSVQPSQNPDTDGSNSGVVRNMRLMGGKGAGERASEVMGISSSVQLEAYPVSTRVNKPVNDDPGCIERVA